MQDVLIDDKYVDKIEVIAVDSLDEVMEQALIKHEQKAGPSSASVQLSTG